VTVTATVINLRVIYVQHAYIWGMKIFLIGFMGSGKTHWGKLWAERRRMEFFDLDAMIEAKEKKTIDAIFNENGETYFRGAEIAALKTFADKDNCIIACGGGTPCFHNNMQWMKSNGTTVYLQATPVEIMERVKDEKHKRPLLKKLDNDEILLFIAQKIKEREPFYLQAQIILPVKELNIDSFKKIINS
jgi:shikimate kinase